MIGAEAKVQGLFKQCRVCGELKPLEEFSKRAGSQDGHRNDCKACNKVYREQKAYDRWVNEGRIQEEPSIVYLPPTSSDVLEVAEKHMSPFLSVVCLIIGLVIGALAMSLRG